MKREYKIQIEREGRWWMVHIPELDGLTQARRLSEAELMAREWIAVSTGTPISDISVDVAGITVPGVGFEISARARRVEAARRAAVEAHETAQREAADYARALTNASVPVRDTAELLHVAPQRVSQLTSCQ